MLVVILNEGILCESSETENDRMDFLKQKEPLETLNVCVQSENHHYLNKAI